MARQTIGTLNLNNSKFVNPLKIPVIFLLVLLCDYSRIVQTLATPKIIIASSPSRLIIESVKSELIGPSNLQYPHELFVPFKLAELFVLGF